LQVLGEVFAVLTRRRGWHATDARTVVTELSQAFAVITPTCATLVRAMFLTERHAVSIWDAQIVCVAASGGCNVLVSEDLQDRRTFQAPDVDRNIVVINPFDDANLEVLRESGLRV